MSAEVENDELMLLLSEVAKLGLDGDDDSEDNGAHDHGGCQEHYHTPAGGLDHTLSSTQYPSTHTSPASVPFPGSSLTSNNNNNNNNNHNHHNTRKTYTKSSEVFFSTPTEQIYSAQNGWSQPGLTSTDHHGRATAQNPFSSSGAPNGSPAYLNSAESVRSIFSTSSIAAATPSTVPAVFIPPPSHLYAGNLGGSGPQNQQQQQQHPPMTANGSFLQQLNLNQNYPSPQPHAPFDAMQNSVHNSNNNMNVFASLSTSSTATSRQTTPFDAAPVSISNTTMNNNNNHNNNAHHIISRNLLMDSLYNNTTITTPTAYPFRPSPQSVTPNSTNRRMLASIANQLTGTAAAVNPTNSSPSLSLPFTTSTTTSPQGSPTTRHVVANKGPVNLPNNNNNNNNNIMSMNMNGNNNNKVVSPSEVQEMRNLLLQHVLSVDNSRLNDPTNPFAPYQLFVTLRLPSSSPSPTINIVTTVMTQCKSQKGCRVLQSVLEEEFRQEMKKEEEKEVKKENSVENSLVIQVLLAALQYDYLHPPSHSHPHHPNLHGSFSEVMADSYGNFIIQKMFTLFNKKMRRYILTETNLKYSLFNHISNSRHGTFAVQKLIETINPNDNNHNNNNNNNGRREKDGVISEGEEEEESLLLLVEEEEDIIIHIFTSYTDLRALLVHEHGVHVVYKYLNYIKKKYYENNNNNNNNNNHHYPPHLSSGVRRLLQEGKKTLSDIVYDKVSFLYNTILQDERQHYPHTPSSTTTTTTTNNNINHNNNHNNNSICNSRNGCCAVQKVMKYFLFFFYENSTTREEEKGGQKEHNYFVEFLRGILFTHPDEDNNNNNNNTTPHYQRNNIRLCTNAYGNYVISLILEIAFANSNLFFLIQQFAQNLFQPQYNHHNNNNNNNNNNGDVPQQRQNDDEEKESERLSFVLSFCKNKFASNVLEKLLEFSDETIMRLFSLFLLSSSAPYHHQQHQNHNNIYNNNNNNNLRELLLDPIGNYVIQTYLKYVPSSLLLMTSPAAAPNNNNNTILGCLINSIPLLENKKFGEKMKTQIQLAQMKVNEQ